MKQSVPTLQSQFAFSCSHDWKQGQLSRVTVYDVEQYCSNNWWLLNSRTSWRDNLLTTKDNICRRVLQCCVFKWLSANASRSFTSLSLLLTPSFWLSFEPACIWCSHSSFHNSSEDPGAITSSTAEIDCLAFHQPAFGALISCFPRHPWRGTHWTYASNL